MRSKIIKLKPIDLNKCCKKKGGDGFCWHPHINKNKQYLAKIDGDYFAGNFSEQWYGWSFNGWGENGLQLDKPGTNKSRWKGLWEIQ